MIFPHDLAANPQKSQSKTMFLKRYSLSNPKVKRTKEDFLLQNEINEKKRRLNN